jgi:outer membrane receptor protein involved in Fe transport
MKTLFSVAFVTAATLGMGAAMAQDTVALEEIVVTASKREQTLNDIPVAVSVTSAETIQKAHISDILDLHMAVPSLRTSQLQTSTQTNFIIRGFGNGANNPGIESSVGVFIDGVYRSRSASQIGDLVDVERIEVLRGPQSTLFGQNASVGVISVITRKPSFTRTGSLELGYGEYDAKTARAYYSAPIGERAAFSLAGNYNERDGYFRNLDSGHDLNDRNRWDLRGQWLFNFSDDLSFRLIADTSEISELCCGVSSLQDGPTGAIIRGIGGEISGSLSDRQGHYNKDPYNNVDNDGVSLQVDWTHGNWTLTSITADRNQKAKFDYDADFTSADILAQNLNESTIRTFTEELRLAFDNGGPVTGLVGGYYFDESVDYKDTLAWGDDIRPYATGLIVGQGGSPFTLSAIEAALGLPVGTTLLQGGQGQVITTKQTSEVTTAFGQIDWKIVDRLTLTAGCGQCQCQEKRGDQPDRHRRLLVAQLRPARLWRRLPGFDRS